MSPGCDHCYAETLAKRWGFDVWGPGKPRRFFEQKHWDEPLRWERAAAKAGVRRRVFCASMADVFDNEVPSEWRRELWKLIAITPYLDWLLLTKRIGNVSKVAGFFDGWPRNVWLGASVVNQEEADRDIPKLLRVPAGRHFISYEPALDQVLLRGNWVWPISPEGLDWVIMGGESGPKARPMSPGWARYMRDQCKEFGVAFFMKQMTKKAPIPDDLMVRQFPAPLTKVQSA